MTSKPAKTDIDPIYIAGAEYMARNIAKQVPFAPIPKNFNKWSDVIRKMHQLDSIPLETIGNVFRFANGHAFWGGVIQSPSSLRKHFSRIHHQMEQESTRAARQTKPRSGRQQTGATDKNSSDWTDDIR